MNNHQPTQTPWQPPLPPGQRQLEPAEPDYWTVVHHPQQSHFQVLPAQSLHPPPPEHSAFYTNDTFPQWHGRQHQYQQPQYHILPPVAQPPAQPIYRPYLPVADYPQYYVPQPVVSPQPQLPYYHHLQLQQQQQQRLYHTPPQDLRPAKRQRFDGPNLTRQAHHAPLPPQPQFQHLPLLVQNTGVYPGQSQGSGYGDGGGWPNNLQPSANKGGQRVNLRGESGRRDARRRSMAGNRGEKADIGSYQSGCGVHAHALGGNSGGALSVQDEGCNLFPDSAEHAAVPVATQFQGAQHVSISGNTRFIGMNTGNLTTVNNYSGIQGLENLKEFVSFAALHDSAEQDPDRRCHPGTRETVLKQLRDWIDNPNSTDRIFWLRGPAGAGKSAIAQTIADEYKEQGVAAIFFFFRSDPTRNDGSRLFPTIAWQLAFSIPVIKDFIVRGLDEMPHLPTKRVETQFEQLVAHPFYAMNHIATQMLHPAPVVIVDGVDECSNEQLQRRILSLIGNEVKDRRVPLRFLICSRPEALIEETLDQFKKFTLRIDLATLNDSHRDIEKYLADKFSDISSKHGLDPTWPGQKIIDEIVFKSSGNFIFAATVMRFISDEDNDPEVQLDIVRNLKPHGTTFPFAILDELYLEILKRQPDQHFLKTFLALLVGRSSIKLDNLHEDDAMLMNVSEKGLRIKLRRMRSLLKFGPFIDIYHKSFLDFLQDPSRSGQYHVSEYGALKRYLELFVDSVVLHISMAIEQPDCHGTCGFSPVCKSIVTSLPPMIVLSYEDWQDALKPLLDKIFKMSKPQSCRITQIMRDLILHLVFLQGTSRRITISQALASNMNEIVTERSPALMIEAQQNLPETDLDNCLSALLNCLQETDSMMVVDVAIIGRMLSLLAFDYTTIVARVLTVSDAQKLIDIIDLLVNNKWFLSQCSADAACKAARLASEIFAKAPLFPRSHCLNNYIWHPRSNLFELPCQSAFISRILDHNYIVPLLGINGESDGFSLARSNDDESVNSWLRTNPDLVTRIRVILEVARAIRYIHSMDVALHSVWINSRYVFLDSNLHAKIEFIGLFAWWVREASIYGHELSDLFAECTYESNISAFAHLFQEVCFGDRKENLSDRLVEDAMALIERCRAMDPQSRPSMMDVVKEIETWDLT